jgi:hypothetical protein
VRSFRRAHTLRECQAQAQQQVQRTARQADGAGLSRDAAAQARAAVEQLARVDAALAELPAIEAAKQRNGRRPKHPSEARASTTDPEARIMKMADGGYRPAYNLQFATDAAGRAIVGVAVTHRGGDQQEWVSMVNQIEQRTGRVPDEMLVDGGYVSHEGLDTLTRRGLMVFAPPRRRPGRSEAAPVQPRDSMAVALWRARMQTPEAQAIYRLRGSVAERVFADVRAHRMPGQIPVRGLHKVHTWALWIALAINVMRAMEIVPHLMT